MLRRAPLGKKGGVESALAACVALAATDPRFAHAAHTLTVDSTGLSVTRASAYYVWRGRPSPARPGPRAGGGDWWRDGGWAAVPQRRRWPKLTAVADVATHLVLALDVTWGPTQDAPHFLPVLAQACAALGAAGPAPRLAAVLADAGYDSERNLAGARALGVRCPVIARNPGRWGAQLPRTPERRRLARRFPHARYRQRAHAESVFSRLKRDFGPTLSARRAAYQLHELLLRVVAYDIGLLRRARLPFN